MVCGSVAPKELHFCVGIFEGWLLLSPGDYGKRLLSVFPLELEFDLELASLVANE